MVTVAGIRKMEFFHLIVIGFHLIVIGFCLIVVGFVENIGDGEIGGGRCFFNRKVTSIGQVGDSTAMPASVPAL